MSERSTKITVHAACSLDGMIAKADNSIAWMEHSNVYENGTDLSAEQISQFLQTIDCYIMGSKTYEHAVALSASYGWAYGETPVIVLSSRKLAAINDKISFYSGDLTQLAESQLAKKYASAWVVGGAAIAKEFIRHHLVDEIRLSVLPIILGNGLSLFEGLGIELPLALNGCRAGKNGIVDLSYRIQ